MKEVIDFNRNDDEEWMMGQFDKAFFRSATKRAEELFSKGLQSLTLSFVWKEPRKLLTSNGEEDFIIYSDY